MVVIVDMADNQRVLIDGMGNFPRVMYPLNRLNLTKLRVPILRGARTGTLTKAVKKFDLEAKWAKVPANLKIQQFSARSAVSDLDRFRIMIGRKQRSYEVRKIAFKAMGGKGAKPAPKKAAAKPVKGKK